MDRDVRTLIFVAQFCHSEGRGGGDLMAIPPPRRLKGGAGKG